jgi:transposase
MDQYAKVTHVGLDNHKNFSKVTARDAGNEVLFRQRLEHADRQHLREQLRRYPPGTPVILEGTFGWGWMADELSEDKHEPHLASSRKVAAWRDARGLAKTNKIDGDLLSELWPQQPRWWEVWLAPPEVRDQREILRYRMALVQVQTMTKNRIHATLHRHGILHGLSDLFGNKGRQFLQTLAEADEPLRDSARLTLRGYLKLLEQVRKQIAAVTRDLRKAVRKNPQAERWRTLPGIAWVLAYTVAAEVGDIARFPDGEHLASYSLLVPLANDSGDERDGPPIGRHVGHAGRRTLKWAFIEAAHGAVRKSAFFRAIYDRRTQGGTKDRNRGYIAVARKLCVVGTACVKKGRPWSEAPPPRPGSAPADAPPPPTPTRKEKRARKKSKVNGQKQQRISRPGLGQPDHPMAVAGR